MASQAPRDYTSAQHFALIYIDQFGEVHHEVSPSIIPYRDAILSPQVTAEFLKAVANSTAVSQRMPSLEDASTQLFPDKLVSYDSHNSRYFENFKVEAHSVSTKSGYHENPTLWLGSEISSSAVPKDELLHKERSSMQKHRMQPQDAILSIKDIKSLRQYYEKVFDSVQQTNCRVLAKAYVKLIEPQKKVKYPYNGRKAVAGVMQQLSPEETKPPWWPHQVRHHEPDHLLKAERIALLIHILCELHCSHGITSRQLRNAEQSVRSQIIPVERLELLDELYRVREEEEKFIEGSLGKDATVLISRNNLPAADISSSKQGRLDSWVSLEYKQNSTLYKSPSRKGVSHSAAEYPQHYFVENITGQDSTSNSFAAPATSSKPPEKEHTMNNEPCFSTAICNPTGLVSTRYVTSHSLFEASPVAEDVGHETRLRAPCSVYSSRQKGMERLYWP